MGVVKVLLQQTGGQEEMVGTAMKAKRREHVHVAHVLQAEHRHEECVEGHPPRKAKAHRLLHAPIEPSASPAAAAPRLWREQREDRRDKV